MKYIMKTYKRAKNLLKKIESEEEECILENKEWKKTYKRNGFGSTAIWFRETF